MGFSVIGVCVGFFLVVSREVFREIFRDVGGVC